MRTRQDVFPLLISSVTSTTMLIDVHIMYILRSQVSFIPTTYQQYHNEMYCSLSLEAIFHTMRKGLQLQKKKEEKIT